MTPGPAGPEEIRMPSVASRAALQRAAGEFPVTHLDLLIEPAARAAAWESVAEAGQPLADHPLLWLGDGRITAGHLAMLRERTAAGGPSAAVW
jgi:endonuclease/exonuclease/phosphatase family metal-dependent hydrolase